MSGGGCRSGVDVGSWDKWSNNVVLRGRPRRAGLSSRQEPAPNPLVASCSTLLGPYQGQPRPLSCTHSETNRCRRVAHPVSCSGSLSHHLPALGSAASALPARSCPGPALQQLPFIVAAAILKATADLDLDSVLAQDDWWAAAVSDAHLDPRRRRGGRNGSCPPISHLRTSLAQGGGRPRD